MLWSIFHTVYEYNKSVAVIADTLWGPWKAENSTAGCDLQA